MQLVYLTAHAVNDESWSGGLLVTDIHGLPLDFRYVEPIRPTKLQKLVYGGALRRYLVLDAIARTLLKASKPSADWIFTGDGLLSELDERLNGRLVVIESSTEDPLSEVGEWIEENVGQVIMQVGSTGNPVKLTFDASDQDETKKIAGELAELAKNLDFSEPLNRISGALMEICENGTE
jgi:hypothetical protein